MSHLSPPHLSPPQRSPHLIPPHRRHQRRRPPVSFAFANSAYGPLAASAPHTDAPPSLLASSRPSRALDLAELPAHKMATPTASTKEDGLSVPAREWAPCPPTAVPARRTPHGAAASVALRSAASPMSIPTESSAHRAMAHYIPQRRRRPGGTHGAHSPWRALI